MKLKLLFIALLACFAGWGQILTFEFSALAGSELTANSSTNTSGLASSIISRGFGLTASANSGRFNSIDWALSSIDNAIIGNDYVQFTISPNSGYQFNISSIIVQWQRSGTGNTQVVLRNSIDNYAANIDGVKSIVDNTSTQTLTWTFSQNNTSSLVTYRLYSFAESNTGSGGPGDGTGDDIIVNGTVSSLAITNTTYTTSWSNSAPTATIDATIAGDLSTTTDLTCKDLTINSGKTLTIGAGKKLSVTGNLINNGTLVFKSDATGTAVFDVFSGSLSPAGSTIVERYIPARRAYRFLSPAVTTSTTIRQNWQENGGTAAGLGTHITGATGASAGFDPTETNNSSLLLFNSGAWVGATNTNVSLLTAGNAYCLMVRGDRTTDLTSNTPTASNTVLRATGTLFTGNFTPALSTAASGYSFIGNPYQAPLDIKTALQSSTDVNKNVVYYWDPTINARGGYITRNLQNSINSPTSNVNDYVQPGQAFFVVNEPTLTSTPALTFTENHKSVANAAAGVFRNANSNEYGTLRVNLQANTNNQWQTIEGAVAIFNSNFSTAVTEEDATKMTNLDEEVSFVQNNTSLAIACQPNPALTSELPIRLNKTRHTNYQWQFDIANYSGPTPFLVDTQNNSITQITNTTVVPFTADTNANRFKIVFQNAALNLSDFSTQLALYPNPSKVGESFYIDGISEASITVFNVLGQNIQVQTKSQGNSVQVTPSASLSKGVYLVTITTQGNTQQIKWIVE